MKNIKVKKIMLICISIILVILSINTFVNAIPQPKNISADENVNSPTIKDAGNKIVAILQTVGVVLSVVILIVIGIRYMMGSAEEKAEYKKTFMPYIIGAALIFAASLFAQVAFDFFTQLGGTETN